MDMFMRFRTCIGKSKHFQKVSLFSSEVLFFASDHTIAHTLGKIIIYFFTYFQSSLITLLCDSSALVTAFFYTRS